MKTVGLLVYDQCELLDFAGPCQVFNSANRVLPDPPFEVRILGVQGGPVQTVGGIRIFPEISVYEAPHLDILLLPGGPGRRVQMNQEPLLAWIRERSLHTQWLLTVCTGSFILGRTGLLDGRHATTHHSAYDEFREAFPATRLVAGVKWVEDGPILSSGGISAGIDLCLHVLDLVLGPDAGASTARHMEYDFDPADGCLIP